MQEIDKRVRKVEIEAVCNPPGDKPYVRSGGGWELLTYTREISGLVTDVVELELRVQQMES